ncbi:MAG: DUF1858 domain-containing protein [Cytobacillus gottheilii]|uniref:DUF1858 domain-containing protein n=1 Tax=Cytobacillus gottheilii TaxID=859144 RepID=UPI00082ECB5B|nr:DUF1858 domain-containing protein [Cytobacillus gottheilii]
MPKILDLNLPIYELTAAYPELIEILKELGFEKITDPIMMQTAGRIMTIPKGCRMRGVSIDTVKEICE